MRHSHDSTVTTIIAAILYAVFVRGRVDGLLASAPRGKRDRQKRRRARFSNHSKPKDQRNHDLCLAHSFEWNRQTRREQSLCRLFLFRKGKEPCYSVGSICSCVGEIPLVEWRHSYIRRFAHLKCFLTSLSHRVYTSGSRHLSLIVRSPAVQV